MMNVFITETSWKVALNIMIHIRLVLGLFEEKFLLELPPPPFPFATYSRDSKLNALITVYLSSDHPKFSVRAQSPIFNLGLYPYNYNINFYYFRKANIFFEEVMGKNIYFLKKAFFENILLYIEKHF